MSVEPRRSAAARWRAAGQALPATARHPGARGPAGARARGTTCRPITTFAMAGAIGSVAMPASSTNGGRGQLEVAAHRAALAVDPLQRAARRHGALVRADRRRHSGSPDLAACCARSARRSPPRCGRRALVHRGAPVPDRHLRWHRPADTRGRASRWRRLRGDRADRRATACGAARRACFPPKAPTGASASP